LLVETRQAPYKNLAWSDFAIHAEPPGNLDQADATQSVRAPPVLGNPTAIRPQK